MTAAEIARVCHEVNRAYCQAIGDDSQVSWEEAPEWQRESAEKGVLLLWDNPEWGPAELHEFWMREKLADGWRYHPLKNPELKLHPCIRPFVDLTREQQAKDHLFRAVVAVLKLPDNSGS